MPTAFDRTQPQQDHSPLANLLDFSEITQTTDFFGGLIKQLLDNLPQLVLDAVVGFIKDTTGIDLSGFSELFTGIFDEIGLDLPGLADLNPISLFGELLGFIPGLGTGSPDAAGFINDILNPTGLLASVTAIVNALTGSAGTLTDLDAYFTDLLGIFGNPTGLGTGSPTIPGVGSIPILGPLFGLFGGASNSTQAGNFFTSITSLFGNPTGMTSGSPTVPALGSIPILGPVFGLFAGATTSTQASNVFTNLLGILNSPTGLTTTPGSFNPVTAGVSLLDDFLPGLTGANGLFNGLFGGITKLGGTGRTRDEVNTAVSGQADTVIGTASTMEQILAALGSGTPDSDDFERTSSSSLGANWNVTQTGSGTLATPNGHDANFSGSGSVEYVARKTDKQASTDHQTVTMVFATGIPSYPFFTPLPYGGNNDLWLRMTGFTTFATRTGLRLRVNGNAPYNATWYIHWVNSGTETQLATGSMSIPAAGASISFEVGVGGDMRHYAARLNGTAIPGSDFTDSTDRGLGNRFRGFGGKGATGIGTPQGTANLKQWTAQG